MQKYNLSFSNKAIPAVPNTITIWADGEETAGFLVNVFLGENDVENIDLKSIQMEIEKFYLN